MILCTVCEAPSIMCINLLNDNNYHAGKSVCVIIQLTKIQYLLINNQCSGVTETALSHFLSLSLSLSLSLCVCVCVCVCLLLMQQLTDIIKIKHTMTNCFSPVIYSYLD